MRAQNVVRNSVEVRRKESHTNLRGLTQPSYESFPPCLPWIRTRLVRTQQGAFVGPLEGGKGGQEQSPKAGDVGAAPSTFESCIRSATETPFQPPDIRI